MKNECSAELIKNFFLLTEQPHKKLTESFLNSFLAIKNQAQISLCLIYL